MTKTSKSIEFYAYLPPIQSAIMKSGEGDLMQVKLNINLLISPEAAKLMLMTNKRLKVKVEELLDIPVVEQENLNVKSRKHYSPYTKAKATA